MGCVTKYDKDNITTFFSLCDCNSEVLVIQYDHGLEIADLAIYSTAYSKRMTLWQKARYIWKLLRTNSPYADQLVLSRTQIKDLKNFCNTVLE